MTLRILVSAIMLALSAVGAANAADIRDGTVALARRDYGTAVLIFAPMAARGDPRAQAYLGYIYAHGLSVPQNYIEAAMWYRRASEQGNPTAQYMLGLMYDKGQGVPQDYVLAYKWLNLAVAGATRRQRVDWVRIRDAIATKLSLVQRTAGQELAIQWQPVRER